MTTKTQQPAETVKWNFDFSNRIPEGADITDATVTASPSGLTLGVKVISGRIVQQPISGPAGRYVVTCVATAPGWAREIEFTLIIEDT